MACEPCHRAKVKCEKKDGGESVCSRCERLKLACTNHQSKQGQGLKRRKKSEAVVVKKDIQTTEERLLTSFRMEKTHFGLHYVLRHWISYAISRRSFTLLAKAAALASQCGIQMDNILCGENSFSNSQCGFHRSMKFLEGILLTPGAEQDVSGGPLRLSELLKYPNFLKAIDCWETDTSRNPDKRWICIREMKEGKSRFYVSEAFGRDITSWEEIEATWRANSLQQVKDIWLPKDERGKYAQGLIQQFAYYKEPSFPPCPTRTPPTKILLKNGTIVQVECVMCLSILNLDVAYHSIEYIPPKTAAVTPTRRKTVENALLEPDSLDELDQFVESIDHLDWTEDLDNLMQALQADPAMQYTWNV